MSAHSAENDRAYTAGHAVGEIHRNVVRAFEALGAGFRAALAGTPLTDEQREARRERAYLARIEREREQGRAYVRRIAAEARRDLGLTRLTPPASTAVHNHRPWRPMCPERLVGDQLRGACLNDDGSDRER